MDRTLAVITTTVTLCLATGFVVLAWSGRDTAAYAAFVAGPLVSATVGIVLGRSLGIVRQDVTAVKHQTNQLLTTRLDSVDQALGVAAADRARIAGDGAQ